MAVLDRDISARIRLVRVFCIFFMMYVHVNPGLSGEELAPVLAGFDWILADYLGRASVPALSLVSGLLIVYELARKPYTSAVGRRVQSLLLPLVTWNLLIILLGVLIFELLGQQTAAYRDLKWVGPVSLVLSKLLSLDNCSATPALAFLRDVFVCALLSPLLIHAIKRTGWIALAVIWVAGLINGFEPVIYRAQILMFYTLGIYCALNGRLLHLDGKAIWSLMLLSLGIHILETFYPPAKVFADPWGGELLAVLKRLAMAIAVISLMGRALQYKWLSARIMTVEPRIYLIFLSHNLVFLLLWGIWKLIFGDDLGFPYLIFFLCAPLAAVWLSRYIYAVAVRLPGPLRMALLGR